MKTIKTVEVIPVFIDGYMPDEKLMEERHIYISIQYGVSIHMCLCGCRNKTVLPLHKHEWILTENNKGISFTPSIGNFQLPCKSHYIITDNKANFV